MRRIVYAALFVCLGHSCASAATLYAKLHGGNWSDAATWSTVGCNGGDMSGPPGLADDAIIEACAGPIVIDLNPGVTNAGTVAIAPGADVSADNGGDGITLALGFAGTGIIWTADPSSVLNLGNLVMTMGVAAGSVVTFNGGGQSYGRLVFSWDNPGTGSVVMTGSNTIQTLTLSTPSLFAGTATLSLPAGATTTLGNVTDSAPVIGHYAIVSDTPGMPTTLTKSSGTINIDYLTVIDTAATGGATWCAYRAGADGGGNTGWSFVACPAQPALSLLGVR